MKTNTITVGSIKQISEGGFSAPAYRPARYEIGERWSDDYTGDNKAAHGNIVIEEEESPEGRQRHVAINGHHREVGPWGPTRTQREAHEKREAAKVIAAQEAEEDQAAKSLGISLVSVSGDTVVCRVATGERKTVRISDIREAARAPWHPRLTPEAALAQESAEDKILRLAYRSLLRAADIQSA